MKLIIYLRGRKKNSYSVSCKGSEFLPLDVLVLLLLLDFGDVDGSEEANENQVLIQSFFFTGNTIRLYIFDIIFLVKLVGFVVNPMFVKIFFVY